MAAQRILGPMIRGERVVLGTAEQTVLATWASKCAYAYVSEAQPQNRPWSGVEYRALMDNQHPSRRSLTWLGHSTAPMAYIGTAVEPMYIADHGRERDMLGQPPAGAAAYLAAHGVVFVIHHLPDFVLRSGQWDTRLFDRRWRKGLHRVWPPTGRLRWPTKPIPEARLFGQATFVRRLSNLVSLPIDGRTGEEFSDLARRFQDGENPRDLRGERPS